jgi:hypothetical protein
MPEWVRNLRIRGDVNHDWKVDCNDLSIIKALKKEHQDYNAAADVNNDGKVNGLDFAIEKKLITSGKCDDDEY